MNKDNTKNCWITRFDGLEKLDAKWISMIDEQSRILNLTPDTIIFAPGKSAENMIFLMDGTVRVQQLSDGGREIVLYRIEAGQSCIMTASCLIGHQEYSAEGICETDVKAAVIPRVLFDELMSKSDCFRNFIFSTFSLRLTELMTIINEVAFKRLDIRLAQKLVSLADDNNRVKTTHQKLAIELGTAREVVSRQLQEFQRRDWLKQSRGSIDIQNLKELKELAWQHA